MTKLTSQLEVRLQDRVTGPAKQVSQSLSGITRKMREVNATPLRIGDKINAAMARNSAALASARMGLFDAMAGIYALNRTFGGAVRSAGNFQESMKMVGVLSGASAGDMAKLSDQAKLLGRTTEFTSNQAAQAQQFLAMAGFDSNEILGAMPATLQLASAASMDLASAADVASNVLTGYSMTTEELAHANDVMVTAFTSANTNLQDLGVALKYAGPVASSAGLSFEEASAALALMGNAGIQGSMAGTGLRGAITRMLGPTKEMQKAMKKAGLQFTDANGRLLPMANIIKQLEPHAEDTGLMMELFGQRAGPAMMALISQGSEALKDLTHDMENSGGAAQKVANVKMEGFNGKMRALRSAADGLSMAIGEALLPSLTDLAERLTKAIGPLTEFTQAHPELISNISLAVAGLVGFKAALAGLRFVGLIGQGGALSLLSLGFNGIGRSAGGIKKAATNMVGLQVALAAMEGKQIGKLSRMKFALKGIALAVPGIAPLSAGLTAAAAAMATISAPLWATFAAIAGAIAAAGYAIWKNWDTITSAFSGVAEAIGEDLAPVLEGMRPLLDWFAQQGENIANAWNAASQAIGGAVDSIGNWFGSQNKLTDEEKAATKQRWKEITQSVLDFGADIGEAIEAGGENVRQAGARFGAFLAEGISSSIDGVKAWVAEAFSNVGEWFDFDAWKQAGRDMIMALWEGIKEVFAELKAWMGQQLTNLGNMARNAFSSIPLVGGLVGPAPSSGGEGETTPARAQGGPISRGQSYLVGEKGPELITANRSGYVNPAGSFGGARPVEVTVNSNLTVNGANGDPALIGAEVARHIREQIGEAFRGVQADAGMRFA